MTAPALNSAKLLQKYGVTRSIVHHIATNNFTISLNYADCFSTYRLLYWDSQYLLSKIVDGMLTADYKEYLVIYHRCTRGQVLAAKGQQVALSFRAAKRDFGLVPYVLVSLASTTK